MSKRSTYFENNLRVPKDSCKIVNTLPLDISKVSPISRNFNLQLPKTISWTFVMFYGKTADFGRPDCSASSVFVRPVLNSIPVNDCWFSWCRVPITLIKPLLCFNSIFFSLKSNVWLTLETLFYPLLWKWQKLFYQNFCNFGTERQIVMIFLYTFVACFWRKNDAIYPEFANLRKNIFNFQLKFFMKKALCNKKKLPHHPVDTFCRKPASAKTCGGINWLRLSVEMFF